MKNNSYFTVPEEYAGKSIEDIAKQIASTGGYVPRLDVLSQNAGVASNAPLKAGQAITYAPDTGSGEYKFLQSTFGNPQSENDYIIGQQNKAVEAYKQPIVNQLESEKEPLKARYDKLIESIKGRETQSITEGDISTSQEYARRGIPVQSSAVQKALDALRANTRQNFAGQEITAEGEYQDRNTQLQRDIATLKASVGPEAFSQAMQLIGANLQKYQAETQADQFNKTYGLQQEQLNLQKQQASQPSTSIQTIGGKVKLINTQTGAVIADLGSSSSGSGSLTTTQKQSLAQEILNGASQGRTLADLQKEYGAKLGPDSVKELYNATSIYGPAKDGSTDYVEAYKQADAQQKLQDLNSGSDVPWWKSILGIN